MARRRFSRGGAVAVLGGRLEAVITEPRLTANCGGMVPMDCMSTVPINQSNEMFATDPDLLGPADATRSHDRSSQVYKSSQVKSSQVKSSQVKSSPVSHFRSHTSPLSLTLARGVRARFCLSFFARVLRRHDGRRIERPLLAHLHMYMYMYAQRQSSPVRG